MCGPNVHGGDLNAGRDHTDSPDHIPTGVYAVKSTSASTSTPLRIAMELSAANARKPQATMERDVVVDTGSGASFIEKSLARHLGCRIQKAATPLLFQAFTQGEGDDDTTRALQQVDEWVEVRASVQDYETTWKMWCCTGAPCQALLGRDNCRKSLDQHMLVDPDPDTPSVTFADGVPRPAMPDTPRTRDPTVLHVAVGSGISLPPNWFSEIQRTVQAAVGTDVHLHEQRSAGLYMPDQISTVAAGGRVALIVHNSTTATTTFSADSVITTGTALAADTPLHPATTQALAAIEAVQVLHASRKPQDSEAFGSMELNAEDEAMDALHSDSPPTQAELDGVLQEMVRSAECGDAVQRRRALNILRAVGKKGLWSTKEAKIGRIKDEEVSFIRNTSKPCFVPPYPVGPADAKEMVAQAKKLLAQDIIHPSTSPNNFPLLLVKKPGNPNKRRRMCIDLRKWNNTLLGEWYQLPRVDDLVARLAGGLIFSELDATAGYQMVALDSADGAIPSNHQLAFTLPNGKRYAYKRLCFGIKDAAFSFQKIMARVIAAHMDHTCLYIDDTILYSGSRGQQAAECVDDHLDKLEQLLHTLADSGAKMGAAKTKILRGETAALGHHVRDHRITLSKDRHAAIDQLRAPTTQKELHVAMGLLGQARRFCPGYAALAAPLETLLVGDHRKFRWTDTHQTAYEALKLRFQSAEHLHAPDHSRGYEVWCDASNTATGSCLLQRDDRGLTRIISYQSHKLTQAERNYSVPEREALAMLLATKHYRKCLLTSSKFTLSIYSDHRGLQHLYSCKDYNSRLYRWAESLSEFNYKINYVPGDSNATADAMSRLTAWMQTTQGAMAATEPSTHVFNNTVYTIDRLVTSHTHGQRILFRVKWHGYDHADDTLESLASLRSQLSAQHLRELRQDFTTRTTKTADTALPLLPGTTTVTQGRQAHPPPRAHPSHTAAVAARANDEVLGRTHTQDHTQAPAARTTPGAVRPKVTPDGHLLPQPSALEMVQHQQTDARLQDITAEMAQPEPTTRSKSCSRHANGLLACSYQPGSGPRKGHRLTTIATPDALVPLVLAACHDAAGHMGMTATLFHVQTRFHFPDLARRTRACVAGCAKCGQAKKDSRPHPQGKIAVFDFLDTIGMDHCGPCDRSIQGMKYIAVFVCHSTKWVHTVPVKSVSAADTVAALLDFMQHVGMPGRILTDRGSAFTAKEWKRVLQLANIRGINTTAYNPAGDGHSESMVKAVKQAIRLAMQTDAKRWCMLAKWAAFMHNCSYNSTIGTTPCFCRHGREPRHASDLIFNHPGTTDTVSLSQLVARINKVQASVQASVKAMHQRFIRKNATLNRTRQFKKDDKVWLHRAHPGRTARSANGLGRAWFWPFRPETYRITQKLSAQHVRIKPDDDISNNRSQVVHMRRLKHFKSQDDALDLSIFDRDDLQTVD